MNFNIDSKKIIDCINIYTSFDELVESDFYQDFSKDDLSLFLDEINKICKNDLYPINKKGDEIGAKFNNGEVTTPAGFKEAYKKLSENGWLGLTIPEEFLGSNRPYLVNALIVESLNAANMSFALVVLLTLGSIKVFLAKSPAEQKKLFFEKIINGDWTITMNLTEPQAGSDLGEIKCSAKSLGNGEYEITGQKIYITYGEHDLSENIIHLVLARLEDAPKGVKGISMFIVPKYMYDENGNNLQRNNVKAIGIEKKMGIHASPTCTMQYDKAKGTLIGEENKGLANMFLMMNQARLDIGLQAVGCAATSIDIAEDYANNRKQGRDEASKDGQCPIINHPDIKREILYMKSLLHACRVICYNNAISYDLMKIYHEKGDDKKAKYHHNMVSFLTPLSKAFSSDAAVEITSKALQTHGGMGFIEETGIAQYYRDIRIAPIYEGTNAIQAIDFVTRKLTMDEGEFVNNLFVQIDETINKLADNHNKYNEYAKSLSEAKKMASEIVDFHKENKGKNSLAVATPSLSYFSYFISAWMLADGLIKMEKEASNDEFLHYTEYFYAAILPRTSAIYKEILTSSNSILKTNRG